MSEQKAPKIDPALREPHYEWLDGARLRLFRDDSGRLRLLIEGDRCYLDVKVACAFPHSLPGRHVGFLDGREKVIGLVEDAGGLGEESRRWLERELERRYFLPLILRIHSLKEEFGAVYWEVETDRGPRHFVVQGMRDLVETLGDGTLIISDVDGNRYRIAEWERLDQRSRRMLEPLV